MTGYRHAAIPAVFFAATIAFAQTYSLQRGVALFRQGNYQAALQQLEEARRAHPNDASIENFIGITETKLGRITEADADYENAIRLNPKIPGPYKNLAFNYIGAGEYGLAESQLKIALSLDDADPAVHYYLILLYLATSREKEVVGQVEPAQSFLKNDPATGFLAAKACLSSGAPSEALKLIALLEQESALSMDQEYELGKLLSAKKMYPESAERFRQIVKMQPTWENRYNLAIALLRAQETNPALEALKALAVERPKEANVQSMLASAYEAAGNTGLALAALRNAVAADPHNQDRYLDCTRLLMDLNRYDEAAELAQQGIASVQEPYALTVRLGAIDMMKGEHETAEQVYGKAIAEHPEIALGYVALAQAYMKEGNNEKALEILTDGREKVPRDFALEYALGLVSSQLGQKNQAIEALTSAEHLGPNVVEPHYRLGVLYMEMQQWSKAQEEFESVLRLDPHYAAAYYQLGRTYARLGDAKRAQEMAAEASRFTQTQQDEAIKAEKSRLSSSGPQD